MFSFTKSQKNKFLLGSGSYSTAYLYENKVYLESRCVIKEFIATSDKVWKIFPKIKKIRNGMYIMDYYKDYNRVKALQSDRDFYYLLSCMVWNCENRQLYIENLIEILSKMKDTPRIIELLQFSKYILRMLGDKYEIWFECPEWNVKLSKSNKIILLDCFLYRKK